MKEKVKSAPKELARRGLGDGSERLRTQVRDVTQGGQQDEYGGDRIENVMYNAPGQAVRGAEFVAGQMIKAELRKRRKAAQTKPEAPGEALAVTQPAPEPPPVAEPPALPEPGLPSLPPPQGEPAALPAGPARQPQALEPHRSTDGMRQPKAVSQPAPRDKAVKSREAAPPQGKPEPDARPAIKTREGIAQGQASSGAHSASPSEIASRLNGQRHRVKTRELDLSPERPGQDVRPIIKTRDGIVRQQGNNQEPLPDMATQSYTRQQAAQARRQTDLPSYKASPEREKPAPAIKTKEAYRQREISKQESLAVTYQREQMISKAKEQRRQACIQENRVVQDRPVAQGDAQSRTAAARSLPQAEYTSTHTSPGNPSRSRAARPTFQQAPETPAREGLDRAGHTVASSQATHPSLPGKARKLARSAAPPFPTATAPLGRGGTPGIKTSDRAARQATKAADRTVRSAQTAVKATARAGQRAAQTARVTAKATATTAKAAAKAVAAGVKAAIAAMEELAAAIAAGGWVVVLIALVICMIGLLVASPFGIFFSAEDSSTGYTMPEAVAQINQEFSDRIEGIKTSYTYDELSIDNAGSSAMVANWDEVLAVYAVRTATDGTAPDEVVTLTAEKLDILRGVFWDMNVITAYTETVPGDEEAGTEDKVILHIDIAIKDHAQMADQYGFTTEQREMLAEMMKAEYQELFMKLTGSYRNITLTPEQAQEILDRLPAGLSETRKQVVLTAYQLLGKVGYFWGGKSRVIGWDSRWGTPTEVTAKGSVTTGTIRPFGLDCSGYVDWVFYNVTDGAYIIGHGGGASRQHTYCTDISWSQAQPGDLVFYPADEHVGIVCGFDAGGNLMVIHCSSGANNVAVSGISGFTSIGRPVYYDD